jgi:hypothetical protein
VWLTGVRIVKLEILPFVRPIGKDLLIGWGWRKGNKNIGYSRINQGFLLIVKLWSLHFNGGQWETGALQDLIYPICSFCRREEDKHKLHDARSTCWLKGVFGDAKEVETRMQEWDG